jgi:glutamine synthetase
MEPQTLDSFLVQHPHITSVDLLIVDLDGVLRGKRVERSLLNKVFTQGFNLPQSVLGLDSTGATVETSHLGVVTGDQDRLCRPIAGTLQLIPWHAAGDRAQVLCAMYEMDGSPLEIYPRHVLERAKARFEKLGYQVGLALELEFYLIDPQRTQEGALQAPVSKVSGNRMNSTQVYSINDLDDYDDFIQAVLDSARAQGIPADAVIAEYAPGQFEVNLNYQQDILKATDDAVLLKRVIHAIARQHGMQATFMAKPYIDEAGNGLHIHMSLLDRDGQNVLAAEDPRENALMRRAVAGLLDMADATQAFCCPTLNSYRRFAKSSFAPTNKTWGLDNRSVAMRIPASNVAATRIENRMAGADANPYFAVTAMLAGITEGIEGKLTPPPYTTGDAYKRGGAMVPDNQRDSLRAMTNDSRIETWFGKETVRVYSEVKWHNLQLFEQQITPMEYALLLPMV